MVEAYLQRIFNGSLDIFFCIKKHHEFDFLDTEGETNLINCHR